MLCSYGIFLTKFLGEFTSHQQHYIIVKQFAFVFFLVFRFFSQALGVICKIPSEHPLIFQWFLTCLRLYDFNCYTKKNIPLKQYNKNILANANFCVMHSDDQRQRIILFRMIIEKSRLNQLHLMTFFNISKKKINVICSLLWRRIILRIEELNWEVLLVDLFHLCQ